MPDKWADYLISAVRYNEEETHIVKVRSHADNDDSVGPASELERLAVVRRLEAGDTYATIYKGSNKWQLGANVREVTIDGTKYIRTDADRIKADNLGELPRF